MPQFHSAAGGPAPVPGPNWLVMDGVDSYKPSTKWSNTKVNVEAASVVWLTMKGLHGWNMLFILLFLSHLKPLFLFNCLFWQHYLTTFDRQVKNAYISLIFKRPLKQT